MAKLRATLRGLAQTPLFVVVAVVSLALGIGVNTAIFSLLDQMLLRKLPVSDPARVGLPVSSGSLAGKCIDAMKRAIHPSAIRRSVSCSAKQTPFIGLAGARAQQVALAYKGHASHGNARLVSGNYFGLLGCVRHWDGC
jgi:putative ABC transport system permease protein